jgi:Ribose/xylose/arabinose/galactoside ABC-type transport systems, permease components
MKNRIQIKDLIPIIALVALFCAFAVGSGGKFVSAYNMTNLIDQTIPIIIGGMGVMFVTALGSTDLSVGANAALSATIGAYAAARLGTWAMIPVALLVSIAIGLLGGLLVTKFKLSSFMTTLALLIGFRGLLNYVLTLDLIYAPSKFIEYNTFPVKLTILCVLIAIMVYVYEYSKIGYYCKTIGENERTVLATGINVNAIRVIAFTISGLMAGIFGIVQIVKVGGSTNSLCNFMEMRILMAIFLGGVLVTGGFSSRIYKLIIGSFAIVIIENGLILCKVDSTLSEAIQGLLLMMVLFATIYFNNRAAKQTKSTGKGQEKIAEKICNCNE